MLWQYQCGPGCTLFYYQWGGNSLPPHDLVTYCPVCRSKHVRRTGRYYPDLDESHSSTEVRRQDAGWRQLVTYTIRHFLDVFDSLKAPYRRRHFKNIADDLRELIQDEPRRVVVKPISEDLESGRVIHLE